MEILNVDFPALGHESFFWQLVDFLARKISCSLYLSDCFIGNASTDDNNGPSVAKQMGDFTDGNENSSQNVCSGILVISAHFFPLKVLFCDLNESLILCFRPLQLPWGDPQPRSLILHPQWPQSPIGMEWFQESGENGLISLKVTWKAQRDYIHSLIFWNWF